VREGDSAAGRVRDQPLIFVGHLFVDPAGNVRLRCLGPASFDLLTKEQIIDVHVRSPHLDPPLSESINGLAV
jgi:hypothetical protein